MGDDMAIHLPTNVRGALMRACMQDNRGYVRICTYIHGHYDTDGMGERLPGQPYDLSARDTCPDSGGTGRDDRALRTYLLTFFWTRSRSPPG